MPLFLWIMLPNTEEYEYEKFFSALAKEKWRKVPSFVSPLRPEQPYSHTELWDRNGTWQQRAMLSLGTECNKKMMSAGGKQALLVDMLQRASVPFQLMERITMEYNFSPCILWASLDAVVEENAKACGTTEVLESLEFRQNTWAGDILFAGFSVLLALLEWVEQSFNNHLLTSCAAWPLGQMFSTGSVTDNREQQCKIQRIKCNS